jgi:hypothetical protein
VEVAVDTSVAVPLIMQAHTSHRQVRGGLLSRDNRAAATYATLGVEVEMIR